MVEQSSVISFQHAAIKRVKRLEPRLQVGVLEAVRRRPISPRFLSIVQTGCAILIIGYILYITFYDVQDLPWRRTREKPAEIKFEPKQELAPAPQTPGTGAAEK